jgi:hypothetical protein
MFSTGLAEGLRVIIMMHWCPTLGQWSWTPSHWMAALLSLAMLMMVVLLLRLLSQPRF